MDQKDDEEGMSRGEDRDRLNCKSCNLVKQKLVTFHECPHYLSQVIMRC